MIHSLTRLSCFYTFFQVPSSFAISTIVDNSFLVPSFIYMYIQTHTLSPSNTIIINQLIKGTRAADMEIATNNNSKRLLKSSSNNSSFRLRSPSLNSLRLRRIFDLFDTNRDSFITVDEISRALILLGLDTDVSDLDSMIKSYIHPGNAGLTYEDFVSLHRSIDDLVFGLTEDVEAESKEEQEEADLTEAFKVFDQNKDGFISAKELQIVLGKLGFTEASEMARVEMMISSVDLNHDGRVDFSEFKDMMQVLK
ncbi:hypothetical protein L6452_41823 [Arctium lappa]|uniref:Uncharacterized protein n=1 Tax=Arctium lappa TaxID=4217 RepID=A0ACB8XHQ9_ARCLA|nr:hypothetical protein L6452_41823 [Arctium lappa]